MYLPLIATNCTVYMRLQLPKPKRRKTHLKLRSENSCRSLSLSFSESSRSPWKVSSSTDCRLVLLISMCRMLVCEKSARQEEEEEYESCITFHFIAVCGGNKSLQLPDLSFINCVFGWWEGGGLGLGSTRYIDSSHKINCKVQSALYLLSIINFFILLSLLFVNSI